MSTDCLLTQFKRAAENNALGRFGFITIKNVQASPFMVQVNQGATIKATGGTFSFRGQSDLTEYISPDDMVSEGTVTPSADSMVFEISKYETPSIKSSNSTQTSFNAFDIKLSQINFLSKAVLKGINNGLETISLSKLKDMILLMVSTEDSSKMIDGGIIVQEDVALQNMTQLALCDMNTNINVEHIIAAPALTRLEIIHSPNAIGDLKIMAEKIWNNGNGRTSGTISVLFVRADYSQTKLTWNGVSLYEAAGTYTPKIYFSAEGVTFGA